MNAPNQSFDCRPELRADIAERLWSVGVYADLSQQFASVGDDAGLAYALRCMVAYVRAAIGSFNDLNAINKTQGKSEDRP